MYQMIINLPMVQWAVNVVLSFVETADLKAQESTNSKEIHDWLAKVLYEAFAENTPKSIGAFQLSNSYCSEGFGAGDSIKHQTIAKLVITENNSYYYVDVKFNYEPENCELNYLVTIQDAVSYTVDKFTKGEFEELINIEYPATVNTTPRALAYFAYTIVKNNGERKILQDILNGIEPSTAFTMLFQQTLTDILENKYDPDKFTKLLTFN